MSNEFYFANLATPEDVDKAGGYCNYEEAARAKFNEEVRSLPHRAYTFFNTLSEEDKGKLAVIMTPPVKLLIVKRDERCANYLSAMLGNNSEEAASTINNEIPGLIESSQEIVSKVREAFPEYDTEMITFVLTGFIVGIVVDGVPCYVAPIEEDKLDTCAPCVNAAMDAVTDRMNRKVAADIIGCLFGDLEAEETDESGAGAANSGESAN